LSYNNPRLSTNCCTTTPPSNRRHLIYSYFIETTGIVEVFRVLLRSYFISDDVLKLNRKDDIELIERLKETANLVFPMPSSSITRDLDLERLRYNAYWRMFGYVIRGKERNFERVQAYNGQFNKTFEAIMLNIAQGVLDKQITIEKLSNPSALAELLEDFQKMLINRTYNEIEDIASYWAVAFESLVNWLDDAKLMVQRLNIRAQGRYPRLIELGQRLRTPIAKESLYLFILAKRMEVFLNKVEQTQWDIRNATSLYDDSLFFKELSSTWYQVTGVDFFQTALTQRRRPMPAQTT
jgi:hypothetical protein